MYDNLQKKISALTAQLANAKSVLEEKNVVIAGLERQLKAYAVKEAKKEKQAKQEVANE